MAADGELTVSRTKKDPDHIPDRQRRILQRVAAGEDWRSAARAEGCTDSYSRVVGTRMKRNPAVAKALGDIREAGMKAAVYDLTTAMKEAEDVCAFAKKHKNAMAYCKGTELRAKLSGLLIERVEVATIDLRSALGSAKSRVLTVINEAQRTHLLSPSDASIPAPAKQDSFGYFGPGCDGDPFAEEGQVGS